MVRSKAFMVVLPPPAFRILTVDLSGGGTTESLAVSLSAEFSDGSELAT
jgi:hypothetical protein